MSLGTQFVTLISMIGMGIFFAASFDTYNRFLKRAKRKIWLVFLNDILFWCLQALLIFFVLFKSNFGEWRFYILIALLCGYSAYQALFKPLYLRLLEIIIRLINQSFDLLLNIGNIMLLKPIKGLFLLIVGILTFFLKMAKNLGQGLFSLAKMLLKAVLSIVGTILKPILRLAAFFWGKLPSALRKPVERIFKKAAGMIKGVANNIIKIYNKWTKKSE